MNASRNDSSGYLGLVQEELHSVSGQFLSIDTEDYTTTVYSGLDEAELRKLPSNLESNLDRVLDVFGEKGLRCTFFVLGRIADRIVPQLRRMADEGHEVASHGMSHRRVLELTPTEFRSELDQSKQLLEDLSGVEVKGFRAPMFSITNDNLWAFDVLKETGFKYDSSVSPVSNFAYGVKEAPLKPHRLHNGLIEVPMSVCKLFGYPLMVGGGFYLRVYPLWVHKLLLRWRQEKVTNYYLHPWELDSSAFNLWDKVPDKGHHWVNRPALMKWIETYNRHRVFEKYLFLVESQAGSNGSTTLNQVLAA